jgi:hypothetical protein
MAITTDDFTLVYLSLEDFNRGTVDYEVGYRLTLLAPNMVKFQNY